MLKKIREVWRDLVVPKRGKLARRKSIRFSKHKFRVHRVGSRRSNNIIDAKSAASCASTAVTRRMDSYHRMTVNVNESTLGENAKGCDDKNPVSSKTTCSLSGHCSTSSTNLVAATEKPGLDEREIEAGHRTNLSKKVVEDTAAECQNASISNPPSNNDVMPVSTTENGSKRSHAPVSKKPRQLKVRNLRFAINLSSNFICFRSVSPYFPNSTSRE